ncbi:MAG: carboxypeptidase regulatory-like domain-containing protein [Acidobacteriota bacterium]|nr:carboxypeptidase regulatory-like domain-containing protein [Acidobacteriota bacterium]
MSNGKAKITAALVMLTSAFFLAQNSLNDSAANASEQSFFTWIAESSGRIFGFSHPAQTTTENKQNSSLSTDEKLAPAACVQPSANFVGWYRGEDNANDSVSLLHGNIEGGVTFTANGRVNKGFSFPGDSAVSVPRLNLGNSYTIEFWLAPNTSNTNYRSLIGNIFNQNGKLGALYTNNDKLEYWHNSAQSIVTPAGSLPMDGATWTHVALRYDGATAQLYINGAVSGSPYSTTAMTFDNNLKFGSAVLASSPPYIGRMDEISFYNRALSDLEIAGIFNAGTDGKCNTALRIAPALRTVFINNQVSFSAVNGIAPFVFSLVANNSGGSIDAQTGAYTAGANAGTDTIRVTDANNNFAEATVTVEVPACVAGEKTWDGGGTTENWSEPANWTCNQVPSSTDRIIFNAASTKNSTIDTSRTINNLQINTGYTGTITQGANSTVNVAFNFNFPVFIQSDGTFVCSAAPLNFDSVTFTQTGGTFNCAAGSSLRFDSTNQAFALNGGMFVAPAGNLIFAGGVVNFNGGTFNHNNGTVVFSHYAGANGSADNLTLNVNGTNAGTLTLFNANFNNTRSSGSTIITEADTIRVLGTANLIDGDITHTNPNNPSAGVVQAEGDVNVSQTFGNADNSGTTGLALLKIVGNAARTVSFPSGLPDSFNRIHLNAPNTTVTTSGTGTVKVLSLLLEAGVVNTGNVAAFALDPVPGSGASILNTQTGGTFTCGAGAFTLFRSSYTMTGGNFNCVAASVFNSTLSQINLNGGTFSAPSTMLRLDGVLSGQTYSLSINGGTFQHNSGTVNFDRGSVPGASSCCSGVNVNGVDAGAIDLFNVNFDNTEGSTSLINRGDTVRVFGTLNFVNGFVRPDPGIATPPTTIEAHGDVNVAATFDATSGFLEPNFVFAGANNQTFTNNGAPNLTGTWTINKPSGTVIAATSLILLAHQPLNITSGTLYLNNNSNLTTGALSVGANGKLVNESATTITLGGNVSNSGVVDLQGGGAACPETDSILIRSSDTTQRTWTGSGRYRLVDVDVQRMGGAGTKTVFSGTNSGNNNTSWVFDSNCPTTLSITPSNVGLQTGASQTFTAGGGFAPYTFSILTNNSGASINPSTGVYTAGQTAGTDTVRVTDVFGSTADATVNVFGVPSRLAFTVQPSNTTAGQTIFPSVRVAVQDANGNTVTNSTAAIAVSLLNSTNGGTLSGALTRNAVNGIATFNNLSIDRVSNFYSLRATSGSLNAATSNDFAVTPAAASRIVFANQPTDANQNSPIVPAVQVDVQDAFGNLVPNATSQITIAIGNNPSSGVLSGTATLNAVNGAAIFEDLRINNAGNGYTLTASSPSLTSATSAPFNIINQFAVTNTNNSGAGSLRQAILNANQNVGVQTISFNISGTAPFVIAPTTELPVITDPVIIDGTTQPGFNGTPIIQIDGVNVPASDMSMSGLKITAGNSTVKALSITRFRAGGNNFISGAAIRLQNNGGNTIQGNYLGITPGGAAGRNLFAVKIESSNNTIGGTTAAQRNVISGNDSGVVCNGQPVVNCNNNTVRGNYIGVNPGGNDAIANGTGIALVGNGHAVLENVISGNTAQAINLLSTANNISVSNNLIGIGAEGVSILGNGEEGVLISPRGRQIRLTGNRLAGSGNGKLGIKLSKGATASPIDQPLPNDPQDLDSTGVANEGQNYPVLTSATSFSGNSIISGTLNSRSSQTYMLEFFSSTSCAASGHGEGEIYLGSTQITTDAGGIAGFSANLPVSTAIGRVITATATDANGNTSEFSQCSSPVAPAVFSISGRIVDTNGNPVANTLIGVQGARRVATTDSNGNYRLDNIPGGANLTLTPTRTNTTFSPASLTFNNLSANQTDQNFTATTRAGIRGKVQSSINGSTVPIGGVSVVLSGTGVNQTAITDTYGNYSFSNVVAGNYTLTPSKPVFTFNPTSENINLGANDQIVNFLASAVELNFGRIAFNHASGISVMNSDGSGITPLTTNFAACSDPSFSRDGSKIVAICSNSRNSSLPNFIVTMNFDGSNQQIVKNNGRNAEPVWSPDKTKIAFIEDLNNALRLRVMNSDGSNVVTIHSGGGSIEGLSWSADGSKIAFAKSISLLRSTRIFVVNADGTNPVQLTSDGSSCHADWSPDGSKIAFIKVTGSNTCFRGNIHLINPDGTGQTQITTNDAFYLVRWTPNGEKLAFYSTFDPAFGIMNVNGSNRINITNIPMQFIHLSLQRTFSASIETGGNMGVNVGAASITFNNVTSNGAVTVVPIPPASAGSVPNGFILGNQAYEISTTASVSPPVTVCLTVPQATTQAQFNQLRILHNEGGVLVDRTIIAPDAPAPDFATRRLCARTNSLSPFVLAELINPNLPRISGLAANVDGNPLVGVTVNLTGAATRTTQTDSNGEFSFVNLTPGGNYNVQPKQVGYLFTEYSQDFVNLTGENTVAFVGAASSFSISGRVTNESGNPLGNVTVDLDGASQATTQTDANGNYAFANLPAEGFYTVTPSNGTNNFTPSQAAIDLLTADAVGVDFQMLAAASTFSIGGTVAYGITPAGQNVKPVPNVSLTATAGDSSIPAETDSEGVYLLDNLAGGVDYTVTPLKTGHIKGITAFDATLVLRCVAAGANCALNDNQKIAGDTDNSAPVTAFDATQILRFVAANGQNSATGQTGNWKFLPASRNYSLTDSLSGQNYQAVLVGDVDGSWSLETNSQLFGDEATDSGEQIEKSDESENFVDSSTNGLAEQSLKTEDFVQVGAPLGKSVRLELPSKIDEGKDSLIVVPIRFTNPKDADISSYYFEVVFDSKRLRLDETPYDAANTLSSGFLVVTDTEKTGRIGIAASATSGSAKSSGTLLYLRFRATKPTNNENINAPILRFGQKPTFQDSEGKSIAVGKSVFAF